MKIDIYCFQAFAICYPTSPRPRCSATSASPSLTSSKKEKLVIEHYDMKKIETMALDSKEVNEVFKLKNEIEQKDQSLIDGIKPYKLLSEIYDILMKRIE